MDRTVKSLKSELEYWKNEVINQQRYLSYLVNKCEGIVNKLKKLERVGDANAK